ncbi:MAG: M14 family zinc carboxypeptidase [Kangiellaceae bacterium]|nr:M14 family zinc carboxypeptidase [Kangiellaceae bacterium]
MSIGHTAKGADIYAVTVTDESATQSVEKNGVFVIGAVNGEPAPVSFLLYTISRLLSDYAAGTNDELKLILKTSELYFIPVVHVDGYKALSDGFLSGETLADAYHPKNFADDAVCVSDSEASGVNLDRNFPHDWNADDVGSSPDPCSPDYRGSELFSEPETKRVDDWSIQHPAALGLTY